ncbi:MAG TPA: hypothetical protein VG942_11310 [Hyphomonadaceae bacterium]|nr:hypothetical protein [Hyphomonadaceae bacterium]
MKASLVAGLALAVAASVSLAPLSPAYGQKPPKPADANFKTPYNSFGQPDISGYWTNVTLTPLARSPIYGDRAVYTDAEVKTIEGDVARQHKLGSAVTDPNRGAPKAGQDVGGYNTPYLDPGNLIMRVGGEPRTSLLTTPNGRPPLTRAQLAAQASGKGPATGGGAPRGGSFAQNLAPGAVSGAPIGGIAFRIEEDGTIAALDGDTSNQWRPTNNPEERAPSERCLTSFGRNAAPPMSANGYYNNNYQFIQGKDSVGILAEMVHDLRIVRLNSKHRTDGIRPWFGDSIGWYEGDTLVVETTNFPRSQAFQGSWENLKVTERFKRVAEDRVLYQFSVEDPTMWDNPWGGEYEFGALDGRVYEYACHEGNYAMTGILAGSRQAERQEAAAKRGKQ